MLPTQPGSNPQPPDHQSDVHPTEPQRPANKSKKKFFVAEDILSFIYIYS